MNKDDGFGRSPAGPGYSAEPEPSCTVSAVPVSIPNARDALASLIAAVEFEAQRIASESEVEEIRNSGLILLECAREAKPSLTYQYQRAAMGQNGPASAIETRQGGDVQQAPSRSDESAVGASRDAQPPTGDPSNG